MALTSEQWKSLEDMAQQIGRETIANGLGSPQAQGTGSPSYSENASPRERYNQLWEIRKQQAAEAAESAEQREERRERVRSNFLTTMNQVQEKQSRTNEASTTPVPGSVQAQNLEFLSQYQKENSLLSRLKKTGQAAVSGIKDAVASNTDAQRALYEAGQSGREARMQEDLKDLEERLAEAQRAYGQLKEQVAAGNRDFTERDVQDKADQIKQLEVQISAYKKAPEAQRGATEETSKLADEVKKSAEADIERAKKGRGKLGSFFMDAVAGGTQLLGDIGVGALTGGGAMPSLALRSFGGGTQQARQAGASLGQQIGFGAATATVEMLTEKMADGLAGAFGKGAADDVAEEVIRRLASTPTGQTALRTLYSMGGEGVEEIVSELVSPALKAIYDKGQSAKESYGTKEGRKALAADALYSGLLGAALGAPGSAVNIATGRDAQANARNQELSDIYKEIGTPGIKQAVKDRGILENIKGGKDYGNLSIGEQANEAMEALRGRTPESVRAGQLAGARNRLFEIQQQRAAEAKAARQNAAPPVQPAGTQIQQENRAIIMDMLDRGRVSNTQAEAIIDDPGLAEAFKEFSGYDLQGTREEKRTTIQRYFREQSANRAGSEEAARLAAEQAEAEEARKQAQREQQAREEAEQAAAKREKAEQEQIRAERAAEEPHLTPAQSYVRGLLISYREAGSGVSLREILKNAEYRQAFEQLTGIELDKSNNRAFAQLQEAARGIQSGEAETILRAQWNTPQEAAEAQEPTTRNPLYEAIRPRTEAVAESATTPQTPKNAPQTQEVPTGEITPPTAQNAQGEAGAQPQTAETAQERLEKAQARYDEIDRLFSSNEVSDEDAPGLVAEMEQRYNEIQELTPLAERERQSAADAQTQQQRVEAGEVSKGYGTTENHIDRRTPESVAKTGVKSFQFDHPQLHDYYVEAAQALMDEVQAAEAADYERKVNKNTQRKTGSAIKGPVRRLMDLGLTKPQILKCLEDIISDNGQENYAAAKKVELVLNDMLTNGWTSTRGRKNYHEPNAAYISAKDAIGGGIKADSWEKYLAQNELALIDGTVTEEELRQEWEQMHQQEEAATVAEPETASEASQPVETASAGSEQSAGTIPASEQTTAERTNGTGNERERNMAANLRQNEKAEPALRQDFEENRELYTQLTNAEVTQKAEAILAKGYESARNAVQQAVGQAKAGMKLAPEMAVAGYHVATEMAKRGDIAAARELCSDIAAELTYSGQLSQIGRLIIAADPSIRISTVEKLVKKLNDGMSSRQKAKNVKQGKGAENGNITVSDEALQRYAEAKTEAEQNEALDAIEQEIADQIPATFRDKFTALRYLNMLGNLKTQGRNIVGNAAMMTATNVKYLTQHVMELARAAATGGEYQGNTALNTSKELRQQAAADFEAHMDEIQGDAKYADVGRQAAKGVREKQQIFGTTGNALWDNTIGRGLEGARKATNWAMEVGDEIFMRQVYVRSFAGWMKAHGVTDVNNASVEQASAAREFAKKEAQEATFHDSNKVSDWVSSLGRGPNTPEAVKMISEGVVPFRKTPANVAVRAIEYSPVGAIGTIYEAIQAKKGNASAADVINSAAKNLTGSALFAVGMMLAAAGRARASGDDEDEKLNEFEKLQGQMDYSIKVGDKYISLSQLAPMAIPFFMGVKLNELLVSNDNLFSVDSIGDLLGVVSDPMLEMSMLSGVNDFLNDLSSLNGDTDAVPSLVTNAALSYLSQGLTNSLLGQLEQASERNRQTTYSDTKSKDATGFDRFLGKNQYKIGKYSAKIPGIDYNQQDYVDAWGRTQSNGGAGERAFNAFLNPTYTGKDRSTDVDEELERLYRDNKGKDGFPNVFPQKRSRSDVIGDGVVMTPDEYLSYSKESGQKKLELVREFMQSGDYKNLTDEQRAETIHNLYAFADATALQKVRDANGVKSVSDYTKLLQGVVKPGNGTDNDIPALKEKNAAEYISFDTSYKGAVKAGDYSNIDNLLARYLKLDKNTQAVIAAKNPENINNLLKYSQAGVKSQSYFTIQNAIDDAQIELDKSGKTGGDVQMLGLANANIPESEKAKLIESGAFKLSKNRKAAYDVLTDYGYTVKDAYEFFEDADYSYSPKQSQYVADGTLSPLEVAAAIQRSGIPDNQKAAAFDAVRDLLKGDGGKNDTWVNQRTGKPWTYQSEIDYIQKTGYTYGKGGSARPKSSGNVLYDYYAERMKNAK